MTRVNEESVGVVPGMTGPDDLSRSAPSESAASLDKVRDILFGVQMREFERRFARLEERLVKETGDLKEEVKRRLDTLEAYARQESEALAERIGKEQAARTDAGRDLSREIAGHAARSEQRAAALEEQLSKAQRDSRQALLEQYQRLSDEVRTKVDDVLATLAREAHELRSEKADRAVIATLLNEMAMRLTGSLTIPSVEELGNA